jgi:hypothetical protein
MTDPTEKHSPERWNSAKVTKPRGAMPCLDFRGFPAMFRATFEKFEPQNA